MDVLKEYLEYIFICFYLTSTYRNRIWDFLDFFQFLSVVTHWNVTMYNNHSLCSNTKNVAVNLIGLNESFLLIYRFSIHMLYRCISRQPTKVIDHSSLYDLTLSYWVKLSLISSCYFYIVLCHCSSSDTQINLFGIWILFYNELLFS